MIVYVPISNFGSQFGLNRVYKTWALLWIVCEQLGCGLALFMWLWVRKQGFHMLISLKRARRA